MKRESGFTLIEMIIALTLMGVMARLMTLSYADFQESFAKNDARYQLDADLRRLRNEAVAAGGRGVLVIGADGRSYTAGVDFTPYGSGTFDRQLFKRSLPSMITIVTGQQVMVNSRGYVIDSSGALSSTEISLRYGDEVYYTATLYPTGALS